MEATSEGCVDDDDVCFRFPVPVPVVQCPPHFQVGDDVRDGYWGEDGDVYGKKSRLGSSSILHARSIGSSLGVHLNQQATCYLVCYKCFLPCVFWRSCFWLWCRHACSSPDVDHVEPLNRAPKSHHGQNKPARQTRNRIKTVSAMHKLHR
jgi:hypothetical protein